MSFISSAKRCRWNRLREKRLSLDDLEVLFDQPGTEAGEEANLVQGGPVPGHIVDPFKVPEVTVYIVGVMVSHPGNLAGKVALKVQGHNLPLVADGRAQVMDGAACGEELPVSLFPSMHGVAHSGTGGTQDEGEVSHGEQSPLLVGLLAEASYSLGEQ
ncbi:hypothetical protein M1N87_00185, partial [Dehalococcoidia bacterium]|nr:hypothetical protein [Dehalococcoidia bacterium]